MEDMESGKYTALFKPLVHTGRGFYPVAVILVLIIAWGVEAYARQLTHGLGVTGLNEPVFWGMYISNTVFFIAISYGGTLTSAILRILNAEWRKPITRAAETITVCALIVGSLNIIIDMGRPDRIPLLLMRGRLQSPILWDFYAISLYLLCSVIYLYLPLIPDLAILRDKYPSRRRLYSFLTLGWTGSEKQKRRLDTAIGVMALLMIPIAISVHTVLAWLFSMTIQPMWHSTLFGPYFVMGAVYSGIATLIIALAILRRALRLEKYLKPVHFNNLGLLLLVLTFVWFYFTAAEYLTTYYGNEPAHMAVFNAKFSGEFAPLFWLQVLLCLVVPVGILVPRRTRTIAGTVIAGVAVNIGMWLERVLIVVPTLTHPRTPYGWEILYRPSVVEWAIMAASAAAIVLMFMFFTKLFPIVSIWEMEEEAEK
ncbi:MAG: polysulfide reductase [Anaerolineae bacterium]|nr:polysulfide reductase [Anaerolineae bacterium]NIN99355.1 polysulfide reductase [Anaerolineae bacterium]NIQ82220.1 polysulfide reductase [Anaerolineae bacterium]